MRRLCLAAVMLWSASAAATESPFGVSAGSAEVIVSAHGVTPAAGAVAKVRGERIEIEVTSLPETIVTSMAVNDPLVKQIEFVRSAPARVSVIFHSGTTVAPIAAATTFAVVDGELRLTFPRDPTATPPNPAVAALGAQIMATGIPIEATPKTKLEAPPAPEPTPAEPPAAVAPAPTPSPMVAQTAAPTPAAAPSPSLVSAAPSSSMRGPILAVLALAGCGALIWLAKRRRLAGPEGRSIKVLASQSIGRTRVVLIKSGKRELLISVNDRTTRVLGRWRSREEEKQIEPARDSIAAEPRMTRSSLSPAVAGLMRLKNGHGAHAEPSDDAAWTRELLAAARKGNPQ